MEAPGSSGSGHRPPSQPPSRLQQQQPEPLGCGGGGGPTTFRATTARAAAASPSPSPSQGQQQPPRRRPPSRAAEAVQMEVDDSSSTSTTATTVTATAASGRKRPRSPTPRPGGSGAEGAPAKRRRLILHVLPRGQTPPIAPQQRYALAPIRVSSTAAVAGARGGNEDEGQDEGEEGEIVAIIAASSSYHSSNGASTAMVTTTEQQQPAAAATAAEEEEADGGLPPPPGIAPVPPLPTQAQTRPTARTPKQPSPPHTPAWAVRAGNGKDGEPQEEHYICPVCLSLLARPVTLECGFSLCEGCVARALHHAWAVRGTRTAPCPVLGPSCQLPLARLPRVNALLHSHLARRFPTQYAHRLAEARASPTQAIVARVQAHSARLRLRPCLGLRRRPEYRGQGERAQQAQQAQGGRQRAPPPGLALGTPTAAGYGGDDGGYATVGDDDDDEEEEEDALVLVPLLAHLRVALPFLLSLALALAPSPPPPPSTQDRLLLLLPGASSPTPNAFALLLASTPGAHWPVWSLLQATLGGGHNNNTKHGLLGHMEGPQLPEQPPLLPLTGFRHLWADLKLRVALAGALPPGVGFACTWLLLVSAVDLLCAWCRLAAARLRLLLVAHHADEDDDENSNEEEQRGEDATATVARWAATELLILFGSWLWYELIAFAAHHLLHLLLTTAAADSSSSGGGDATTAPQSGSGIGRLLAPLRPAHALYLHLWYLGLFARIVLGPFLPQPQPPPPGRPIRRLRTLTRRPPWQAILMDPRLEMLHAHSSWEVRALSGLAAMGKRRAIACLLGEGGEEGAEGEEEEETPRASRVGEGVPAR